MASPFQSIQTAITSAAGGDTISVAPGLYNESIDFLGRDLNVVSSAGAATTVIDGGMLETVVTFANGETSLARLTGFSIRRGLSTFSLPNPDAGGILVAGNASPVVSSCIIESNQGGFDGAGGIHVASGAPIFEDCIIRQNASNTQLPLANQGLGGGVGVTGGQPVFRRCRISQNLGGNGLGLGGPGGVSVELGDPRFERCLIAGNTGGTVSLPFNRGGAGGVTVIVGTIAMENCIVEGNTGGPPFAFASAGAGGVEIGFPGSTLDHCTITGNTGAGGGLLAAPISTFVVTSCIVWGNTDPNGSPSEIISPFSSIVVQFCDVRGGFTGTGNIALDPQFVSPATSDFRLAPTSPCVDAGDPVGMSTIDFDGDPRPFYGAPDIGADELVGGCFAPSASGADLLRVNAQGGPIVSVGLGQPISLGVAAPQAPNPSADFALLFQLGGPLLGGGAALPWGQLCVPLSSAILASSIPGAGLVPATPLPWSIIHPGLAAPIELVLQGVVELTPPPNATFANTGAIYLRVGP